MIEGLDWAVDQLQADMEDRGIVDFDVTFVIRNGRIESGSVTFPEARDIVTGDGE